MKNAHERFGILEYTKRMKDTTTQVRLRLDRFIGEIDKEGTTEAHLLSVLGGDSDVGAIWAAINEQGSFVVQGPAIRPLTSTLGEGAQCFRGSIAIAGRRSVRHLVAISGELAKTRPGSDVLGKRTVLCDRDPLFVLCRLAQRFGLPAVPEWASWFNEELTRHNALEALLGLGCSPVLVRGTKKMFLKWIGRALREGRIGFPETNGPVCWNVPNSFFRRREVEENTVQ